MAFSIEDERADRLRALAEEVATLPVHDPRTPDEIIEKYGADTLRLYEMFLGPLEQSKPWDTNGIEGMDSRTYVGSYSGAFGSSLLNDLLMQLRWLREGRYQGADYFTID